MGKMKWLLALLLLNAAYVAALPSPTILYVGNVLLHVVLGLGGRRWYCAGNGEAQSRR